MTRKRRKILWEDIRGACEPPRSGPKSQMIVSYSIGSHGNAWSTSLEVLAKEALLVTLRPFWMQEGLTVEE